MTELAIAAVLHERGARQDSALLAAFARDWAARGAIVRGLVDEYGDTPEDCACANALKDVHTGELYRIAQDLGPGSEACRLDTSGIAEAGIALRRAVEGGADLVLSNRFGKLEAAGRGLAQEMLDVMAAGLPLITLVGEGFMPAWRDFTGAAGVVLPPSRPALDAWFLAHVPERRLASSAR